jgi:hypothetical protein
MSTRTDTKESALQRKIRRFYDLLNEHDFAQCHKMIDPRVRAKSSSVTLFQYQSALSQFVGRFGPIEILDIGITLHLNEPNDGSEKVAFGILAQQAYWSEVRC